MTDLTSSMERALTDPMTVLNPDKYVGVVEVHSNSGNQYLVDLVNRTCDCDGYHYGGDSHGRCAHLWRALWATGVEPIPEDIVDAHGEDADPYLGRWSPGEVREEGDDIVEAESDDGAEILRQDDIIEA